MKCGSRRARVRRERHGWQSHPPDSFPRGARKNPQGVITDAAITDAARRTEVINAVNVELAKLDDGKNVRYLDINASFVGQDGKIPFAIMPDQLHPNTAGYQLWADAMKPLLTEMLK